MAFTVNGMGTSVCKAGNSVTWDGQESFDAVECVVFAFLPILPFRTLHTFDWNGFQFRMVPIQWSLKLVLLAFLRRWLWAVVVVASVFLLIGILDFARLPWMAIIAVLALVAAGCFLFALGRGNRGRQCDIRRVLGPHAYGSSDPATWRRDLLQGIVCPPGFHRREEFAVEFQKMLDEQRFCDAMWAARYCSALESEILGERLTDQVLEFDEVQASLEKIGDNSRVWQALFAPRKRPELPQSLREMGPEGATADVGLLPPAAFPEPTKTVDESIRAKSPNRDDRIIRP